ncbi:MAG: SCO family protein [Verrucomicrobiae bacterium]|nr:SCO family protein [Verrucomicrobiae bacterium]
MKLSLWLLGLIAAPSLFADEGWQLTGKILKILDGKSSLVVAYDVIPGFREMPGELEVRVGSGDHAIAKSGEVIRGQLTGKDGTFKLEGIWPADAKTEQAMSLINRDMTRPRIGASKGVLKVGDEFPRFAFYNQLGQLVRPEDLEKRLLVVNFIFTRSKVPTMSAATVKRMAQLQTRLKESGMLEDVKLISISLDPEHDTPGICYAYLDAQGIDHDSYWMLTGSKSALDFLTKKIGVVSVPSEKTIINHSMVLLIVDKEAKIFHRIPGTRWSLDDVYGRLEVLQGGWK